MADQNLFTAAPTPPPAEPPSLLGTARRVWRPAGTGLAIVLTLLLGFHVFAGTHGLNFWRQKYLEHRRLQQQIADYQRQNDELAHRSDSLTHNTDAIAVEIRGGLHYLKSNEVIVTLPPDRKPDTRSENPPAK